MKKVLSLILLFAFTLAFFSCTTNPYTKQDYEKGKKPFHPAFTTATMYIPGLPQITHGEYKEAFYIWGGIAGGLGIGLVDTYLLQNGSNENNELTPLTLVGMSLTAGSYLYSIGDGWSSSITRRSQFNRIRKEERLLESWSVGGYESLLDKEIEVEIVPLLLEKKWENMTAELLMKKNFYVEEADFLNSSYLSGYQILAVLVQQADSAAVLNALSESNERAAEMLGHYLVQIRKSETDFSESYDYLFSSLVRITEFFNDNSINPQEYRESELYSNFLLVALDYNKLIYKNFLNQMSKRGRLAQLEREYYLGTGSAMLSSDELAFLFHTLHKQEHYFDKAGALK